MITQSVGHTATSLKDGKILIAGGEDGTGHLVASMGEATGPVPFTSFMAPPETLARERAMLVRFVRGFYRAQRWMTAL